MLSANFPQQEASKSLSNREALKILQKIVENVRNI
jgi:hypothetical protein